MFRFRDISINSENVCGGSSLVPAAVGSPLPSHPAHAAFLGSIFNVILKHDASLIALWGLEGACVDCRQTQRVTDSIIFKMIKSVLWNPKISVCCRLQSDFCAVKSRGALQCQAGCWTHRWPSAGWPATLCRVLRPVAAPRCPGVHAGLDCCA